MRRHRAALTENHAPAVVAPPINIASLQVRPVVKKTNNRVLYLDLNLTPLENDIKILQLGKSAPWVDCFL